MTTPYDVIFANGLNDYILTSEDQCAFLLPGYVELWGWKPGACGSATVGKGDTWIIQPGDKIWVWWEFVLNTDPYPGDGIDVMKFDISHGGDPESQTVVTPVGAGMQLASMDLDSWAGADLDSITISCPIDDLLPPVGDPDDFSIHVYSIRVSTTAPPAPSSGNRLWIYRSPDGGKTWISRGVTT